MNIYLKLMRVDQYVKNIIVILPLLFSGDLFVDGKILPALLGTFMFCLISSAVYIMNDIADAKADAANPAKCNRPIASGRVPKRNAVLLCSVLVLIPVIVSFICLPWMSGVLISVYFVINIIYSKGLKNIMLLDTIIIVFGFVIRALYGTVVADVYTSIWFYFMVASLVSFTTVGKRLNEKRRMERTGVCIRKVLEKMSEDTIRLCLYAALILTNIFFVIWISDPTLNWTTNPLWTIPFMVLFTYKSFVIIINNDTDHDPLPLFVRDKLWIVTLIVLIGSIVITFYVDVPIINGDVSPITDPLSMMFLGV